jgi:hypothetical protein
MFSLYVGLGKLAALTSLSQPGVERIAEVVARALYILALWRFARSFAGSIQAARAAFLLALFGGGLGLFAFLVGLALGIDQPYSGNWSYETTSFGLLFAAPHVPLGMAATLELAQWLGRHRQASLGGLLWAAAQGGLIALLHPFHAPVLLGALAIVAFVRWRSGLGWGTLAAAVAAALGALPALVPTAITFTLDPFWGATYTAQNLLPSPAPHELFVDVGITLVLAVGGAWFLRGRIAPLGLELWVLLACIAMYLPLPYQRRLGFGMHPALAVMAANALVAMCAAVGRRRAAALRLVVAVLAASTTLVTLASIALSVVAAAPLGIYRSTPDLDAAAAWLDGQVQPGEVILADWGVSNYLAARTHGSMFGGHPVATLHRHDKQSIVTWFFSQRGELEFARDLGVHWVVYGPEQHDLFLPVETPAFVSGVVRVYHVGDD